MFSELGLALAFDKGIEEKVLAIEHGIGELRNPVTENKHPTGALEHQVEFNVAMTEDEEVDVGVRAEIILGKDDEFLARYQALFKNRKDKFRRWRDLSFFCLVGVYALSVVDAYVDASLSEFDISDNLSLKVEPTIINNNTERNPLRQNSLGLSCSLNF